MRFILLAIPIAVAFSLNAALAAEKPALLEFSLSAELAAKGWTMEAEKPERLSRYYDPYIQDPPVEVLRFQNQTKSKMGKGGTPLHPCVNVVIYKTERLEEFMRAREENIEKHRQRARLEKEEEERQRKLGWESCAGRPADWAERIGTGMPLQRTNEFLIVVHEGGESDFADTEKELLHFVGQTLNWFPASMDSKFRADNAFSSWPGKGGALKQGFRFRLAEYPSLKGFSVARDELSVEETRWGMVRHLQLKKDRDEISMLICVAHTSAQNAQEILFRKALFQMNAMGATLRMRGDPLGVRCGDLNFIGSMRLKQDADAQKKHADAARNLEGFIGFTRNNVAFMLEDLAFDRHSKTPAFDLLKLAQEIDEKIKASPDLSPAQFEALRPRITHFQPAVESIVAQEGSSAALRVEVQDPSGEAVQKQLSNHNGAISIHADAAGGFHVRPSERTGRHPIILHAINESLLFSVAEASIVVTGR